MLRTIVMPSYNQGVIQSVFQLIDKNILDVKCWIEYSFDEVKDKDCYIDFVSCYGDWFLTTNKDKIEYYTSNVKFDQNNYDIIFKKVFKLMEFYSRHSIWVDGYTHTYDAFYMFNVFYRFVYGLFYKEKIDFVLFFGFPHEGIDLLVYEIAKSLNIKTLLLEGLDVKPYTILYVTDQSDFGTFNYMLSNEDNKNIDFTTLDKKLETPLYMNEETKRYRDFTTTIIFKKIIKELLKFKKCNINTLRYLIVCYVEVKNYKKHLNENIKQINYDEKFVYFPLHLQPEASTSAIGGIFTDQLLAIELLSDIIPDDWKIVVKENPKQSYFMRSGTFFARFRNIKKAFLCPLDEDTFELIEKCQFVATITGTAGFESLRQNKPILIFGSPFYSFLPGVFKYNKNFNLDDLLNYKVDYSELEASFNKVIKKSLDVTIEKTYKDVILNFNETENNEKLASFIESQLQKLFKYNENRT